MLKTYITDFLATCYVVVFSPKSIESLNISLRELTAFADVQQIEYLRDITYGLRPTTSRSRLRQHQYALKSFFSFLFKLDVTQKNPAAALPLKKKNSKKIEPISAEDAFRLLAAADRSDLHGKRNHLVIAMLWCLGLRINELTRLLATSFEPDHDPKNRIGLLRVRGKNKKQRALFVVDALYDKLCSYLKDWLSEDKEYFITWLISGRRLRLLKDLI